MQCPLPPPPNGGIISASIIIPMRNEERYIGGCLDSILANDFPGKYEVLVVDGDSDDGSREVVAAKAAQHPCIRLLRNPGRFVPSGMNIAIRQARGRYIVRMDAHAEYPSDYIRNCISELERTGAGNVGGRCITRPGSNTPMAKAIALFTQMRVGVGNSWFRLGEGDRYVDTVPFGAFPREVFERVGLYNEELLRNQDFELSARLRCAGYRIYLSSKILTVYYNSGTFRAFMRQAWLNGIWAPRMWVGFPASFCWRHAAPLGFAVGLLSSFLIGVWYRPALWAGLTGLAAYLATTAAAAVWVGARNGWKCSACVVLIMPSYHLLYGLGTMVGLFLDDGARAHSRPATSTA